MDFLFGCDQDDPDVAAHLLSAAMPVDGRLEREALRDSVLRRP